LQPTQDINALGGITRIHCVTQIIIIDYIY
jgi:hypothetical protein